DSEEGRRLSLTQMLGALSRTATQAFRERADAKREEVFEAAKAHVESAAQRLSGSVEQTLEDALERRAVPEEARPVLVTTLQLLLAAGLESVLPRLTLGTRSRRDPSRGERRADLPEAA